MKTVQLPVTYVAFVWFCMLAKLKFISAELVEVQHSPVINTKSGVVVGKIEKLPLGNSVFEYLGIPYAEPPVADLRFSAPKPVKPWSGIRDATVYGNGCPQQIMVLPDNSTMGTPTGSGQLLKGRNVTCQTTFCDEPRVRGCFTDREEHEDEDCLFLNVFVPSTVKPDDKLAVMVWIHGGGFSLGSSIEYPGGMLSSLNDVIIVTINYRLGLLGFFNIPGTELNGNYGIADQILALSWVQENIASFGGNPNQVTIFGESAGGMSVSLLLISPWSKDLFHRAIIQSGAASSPFSCGRVKNTLLVDEFAELINCTGIPSLVECARGKSVADILSVQSKITMPLGKRPNYLTTPVVDGNILPDLPENLYRNGHFHSDVDVITGFTSSEGALFALFIPPDQTKDGMERSLFEAMIRGGFVVRDKNELNLNLILFEYTDHTDPNNKTAIRQALSDCLGDSGFAAPALLEAAALAKGGRQPYVYVFDHRPAHLMLPEWCGTIHGVDVSFTFGAPVANLTAADFPDFMSLVPPKFTQLEEGLSLYMMKMWTEFAKNGSPNFPESPVTWPQFTEEQQAYLVLDLEPRVGYKYRAEKVAFWNDLLPKVTELTAEQGKDENEKKKTKDEL